MLSGTPALLALLGHSWWDARGPRLAPTSLGLWAAGWILFIVCFWATSSGVSDEDRKHQSRFFLVLQALAALWMFHYVCTGLETTLLAVVAAQLGVHVRLPVGLLWLGSQTLGLGLLGLFHWSPLTSLGWVTLTLPFQVLAFFTSYFAASEQQARLSLAQTVAELRATRELLAESTRASERTRISREMHDLLGHHLTALSLNLEVAKHCSSGESLTQIEKCQHLAKSLLNDVRDVVRALHGEGQVDLARVLAPLTTNIPRPMIHLNVPSGIKLSDPEQAHTLIRCVQEIVTNAVRHAAADNLWVELDPGDERLEIRAWDDGRGASDVREGNGLRGMRERLEGLGGRLVINAGVRKGFRIEATIPLAGAQP